MSDKSSHVIVQIDDVTNAVEGGDGADLDREHTPSTVLMGEVQKEHEHPYDDFHPRRHSSMEKLIPVEMDSVKSSVTKSVNAFIRCGDTTKEFLLSTKILWVLVIYTVVGARLFIFLEIDGDLESRREAHDYHLVARDTLLFNYRLLRVRSIHCDRAILEKDQYFKQAIMEFEHNSGFHLPTLDSQWTFWDAALYCTSIYTTVGYGAVTCATIQGRAASIVYAVFGIPLMIVVLDQLGDWLLKGMKELSNLLDDILFFLGVRYHLVHLGAEQQALARYVTVCRRLAKWHLIKGSISITLSAANFDDSESNREEDGEGGRTASSSTTTTTSTSHTPHSGPVNKERRRSFRLELPSGVLSELAYTREGERRPSALYLVPNRDELLTDQSLTGGAPSSTPHSRHSEDGEGENKGGEADFQWDYKGRRDPPVLAALLVTSTWMASCAALFCLWEEWDYFTSIYFFFVSMSTIGFGDVTPKYPQYMMGAFSLVLVGLSLVSVCINVAQEKFSLIYMDLLEETLQQYVKARERGDVDAVKNFVSGFNTSKAKFLMPLISRNENMKIMTQFKQAAKAQGVELPTALTELNPDTGKPAFCKIFEEHEMDEFVKNAELELESKVEKPKLKNTSTQTRGGGEMPMRKGHTFFISRAEPPSQQSFEVAQTHEPSSPVRCTLLESMTQTEKTEVVSTDSGVQCCPSTEEEGTQFDRRYGVVDAGTLTGTGMTRITKSTGVQPDVSCILRHGAYDESYDVDEERVDSEGYPLSGLGSDEGEVTDVSLGVGAKRSLQMRRSARFESSLDELPFSSGAEEEPQRRAVSLAMHLGAASELVRKLGQQKVETTMQLGASETALKEGDEGVVGKRRMRGKKSGKHTAGLRYMRNVGVQVLPQSVEAFNQMGCPCSALEDAACAAERAELIEKSSQTEVLTQRSMETQCTPSPRSIMESETQTAWVVDETAVQTVPVKSECQVTQTDWDKRVEAAMQTNPSLPAVVECRLTQTDNHTWVHEEVQATAFMEKESPPESAYETPPSELQSQLLPPQSRGCGSCSDIAVQVDMRTETASRLVQTQLTSTFQRRSELRGGPVRTKRGRKEIAQKRKVEVQEEEEEEELPAQPTFQMLIDSVSPEAPDDCSLNITLTMPQSVEHASYQPRDELTPTGGCHLLVKEPKTESRAPVDFDSLMKEPNIAAARTEDEDWETETRGDSEGFEEVADFTFDAQTQTANTRTSEVPLPPNPDHDDKWTQTESGVIISFQPQDTVPPSEEAGEEIEASVPESIVDEPVLLPELPTIFPLTIGTAMGRRPSMPVGLESPGKQKESGQQSPKMMLRRQSSVHPQAAQSLRRPSIPLIKLKGRKISRLVTKFEAMQASVAAEGESSKQMLPTQDEERSPDTGVEQWLERGRELDERLGKWAKRRKSIRAVRLNRSERRRRAGKVVLKLAAEASRPPQKQLPEIVEVALAMLPDSVQSIIAEQTAGRESTSARLLYYPGFDLYVHETSGVQMKMEAGALVQVDEPVNLEPVIGAVGESTIGVIVEDGEGKLQFVPHGEGSTSALTGGVVRGKLVASAAGIQLVPAVEADEQLLEELNRMITEGSIQLPQLPHKELDDSSGDEEEEWRELEEFFEIYRKLVAERPDDVFRLLEFSRLDRLEKLAALHTALLTGEYSASRLRELYPIIRERLLRALRSKQSLDRERSEEERRQLESIQQRAARSDRMVSMGMQAGLLTRVMHLFEDEELESELAEVEELRGAMVVSMPEKARHVITLTQESVLGKSEGEDTAYD